MGNPLSYYNGSSYTFTWTQGRRLATAVKDSTIASYTYNESGIRTSKTVDGTKHTYVLNGTSVYSDTWKEGSITHVVVYVYDENGSPIGMMYRNSTMGEGVFEYYIFAKNLQGDIIAVYNSNGTKLVSYKYDAWGNVTRIYSNGGDSTAVRYNSFRYRGYFYDEETGLYYLNSRYYDPAIGRFLNPDIYVNANGDLTGFNMYAYCSNNPVMGYDPTGYVSWWGVIVGAALTVAGVAIAVASYGVASPLGASLIMNGGVMIAATGLITTGCAVAEEAMVIDVSVSDESGFKQGVSLVVDFEKDTFDLYGHHGKTAGTNPFGSFSYSVGFVHDYDEPGDYGGAFVNVGYIGKKGRGIEYCRSPDLNPESCGAVSLAFSSPGSRNTYAGVDYYYQIACWGGD